MRVSGTDTRSRTRVQTLRAIRRRRRRRVRERDTVPVPEKQQLSSPVKPPPPLLGSRAKRVESSREEKRLRKYLYNRSHSVPLRPIDDDYDCTCAMSTKSDYSAARRKRKRDRV